MFLRQFVIGALETSYDDDGKCCWSGRCDLEWGLSRDMRQRESTWRWYKSPLMHGKCSLKLLLRPQQRWRRSIVMSTSVCLCLCVFVCLRAYISRTARALFANFYACCLSPWLGRTPAGWHGAPCHCPFPLATPRERGKGSLISTIAIAPSPWQPQGKGAMLGVFFPYWKCIVWAV